MILNQRELGDGQAVRRGCGLVAIGNLLGLSYHEIRAAFDQAGYSEAGRTRGTTISEVSTMCWKLGHPVTSSRFDRAKRKVSLDGAGLLLVNNWFNQGRHWIAYTDGILQDSANIYQTETRSVKAVVSIR